MNRPMEHPGDPDWAWAAYVPDEDRPWNLQLVGHLFRRVAWGASWPQLQQSLTEGPARTIDRFLQPDDDVTRFERTYDDFDASADGSESADTLRAWWLRRMLLTPDPLQERMTHFWHNHFAISNGRVRNSTMMRRHVHLLRKHALGNFAELLSEVLQDPATLVGTDSAANRRSQPNSNFAQILLEHYTLGPANYQAEDVDQVARTLTGWFVTRGQTRFVAREHDADPKRILGQEGDFAAADLVRILAEHPATAKMLIRKLDRWFVTEGPPPSDELLQPLVERFQRDRELRPIVEIMLRSNRFYSSSSYRSRVKSPVEFGVGMARSLEVLVPTGQLGEDLAQMGENLLHPPTLAGWPAGTDWINPATLTGRRQLVEALVTGREPYGERVGLGDLAKRHLQSVAAPSEQFLIDLLLQGDLPDHVIDAVRQRAAPSDSVLPDVRLQQVAIALMSMPEFQLS